MPLKVLPVTAGALGLLLVVLIALVVLLRRSEKIIVGAGDNKLAEFRIRGHANFIETVPVALILLGIIEYNDYVPLWVIKALSATLFLGRCLHAYAFSQLHPIPVHLKFRGPGMIMTIAVIVISASIAFYNGVIDLLVA